MSDNFWLLTGFFTIFGYVVSHSFEMTDKKFQTFNSTTHENTAEYVKQIKSEIKNWGHKFHRFLTQINCKTSFAKSKNAEDFNFWYVFQWHLTNTHEKFQPSILFTTWGIVYFVRCFFCSNRYFCTEMLWTSIALFLWNKKCWKLQLWELCIKHTCETHIKNSCI